MLKWVSLKNHRGLTNQDSNLRTYPWELLVLPDSRMLLWVCLLFIADQRTFLQLTELDLDQTVHLSIKSHLLLLSTARDLDSLAAAIWDLLSY